MRFHVLHRSAAFLLASTALAAPAAAQLASMPTMPRSRVVDANNVDLVTGKYLSPAAELSIGTENSGMVFSEKLVDGLWWVSNYHIALATTGSNATLTIGTEAKKFTGSGPSYTTDDGDGSSLSYNSGTQNYTYTAREGTIITIPNATRRASMIKYPNGTLFTLYYDQQTVSSVNYYRLRSVGSSGGHQVRLTYSLSTMSNNANNYRAWAAPLTAMLFSNTVETCQPSAASCSFALSWPTLSFSGTLGLTVTSPSGATRYTSAEYPAASGNYRVTGIKRPSSPTSDNTTISYDANNRVSQIVTDGRTWGYGYSLAGSQMTTSETDPDSSPARVTVSDVNLGVPLSSKNSLNKTTSYSYDGYGRLTRVTQPESNYTELTYDTSSPTRGNIVQKKQVSKTPGTPADIVTSATFPSSCMNTLTCNKPTTTTDARGQVTDYTYDSTHGGVLTITRPAPNGGAVRPQTRFGYTSLQAYFMNGSGSVVASGVPTYQLTSTSECQTLSSCANAADEVKTTIGYGSQVAGTANSLYPVSVSKGSGNGALTATTAYTYDDMGNVKFIDGPLSGTVDRTRYSYDESRNLWGVIGPDPDGAGALKNRARRTTFLADMAIRTEYGTTLAQTYPPISGADPWDDFSSLQAVDTYFDLSGRKVKDVLTSGGVAYGVTEYGYDTKGRLQCVAQRMNSSTFGSLPDSKCDAAPKGPQGEDRITKYLYDDADRIWQVQAGVGSLAGAANERTLTYSDNGKITNLVDAENNRTAYAYDGQDRLSVTYFPAQTKGANDSDGSNYEQLTYETTSGGARTSATVASFRNRANESIAFTYDNLGRLALKILPGTEPDVTYGYDNLGRLTSASQPGNSFSFTYDALSRNLTQVSPQGTLTSAWDIAGRRTQLTYPGTGLYVNYDYLNTGEVSKIRENGVTSGVGVLATYAYNDLGRRTSVTFGNGVVQSFTYDPVSRLATFTNDLSGTTNDLTVNPINYNAASGILSSTRTGDTYAWTGPSSQSLSYVSNGLNQYTTVASLTPTYDSRGNLTSDGVNSFGYSSENLLSNGPNSSALAYDPMMRLQQIVSGSSTTRFAYDGLARVAEFDGSNAVQRRYVHGPGTDEPIVWYQGSGTTDRRFLSSDERGSIISVTDSSGTLLGINKYDEFGIPQLDASGININTGKFQYTGQAWLPEIGVYYYKARMYSPTLGRFLQPDPIGFAGGPNLYAYVLNDPANFTDPSGMVMCDGQPADVCGKRDRCTAGWTCDSNIGLLAGLAGAALSQLLRDAAFGEGGAGASNEPSCPAAPVGAMGAKTENQVALTRPGWQTFNAYRSSRISTAETEARFSGEDLHNGPGDAWRHFRWNFAMAQSMGSGAAAAYANAHEVSGGGPATENAMDLRNNAMGRAFASDPRYKNLSPNQAADIALKSGCLQTGL